MLAIAVFGMQLGDINWLGALLVFLLTAMCFLSIGILSASFIMVYKMGNPFGWLFGSVSGLLGGVFFPYCRASSLDQMDIIRPADHLFSGGNATEPADLSQSG